MAFPRGSWLRTDRRREAAAVPGIGAWGRASIFAFLPLVAVLPRMNDANHPLSAGMDMNVSDFNGLLVATLVLVERFDQLQL